MIKNELVSKQEFNSWTYNEHGRVFAVVEAGPRRNYRVACRTTGNSASDAMLPSHRV
jgi:hypothetical protein